MSSWGWRWRQTRLRSPATSHTVLSRKCGFCECRGQGTGSADRVSAPRCGGGKSVAPVWRCPKWSVTVCSNWDLQRQELLVWELSFLYSTPVPLISFFNPLRLCWALFLSFTFTHFTHQLKTFSVTFHPDSVKKFKWSLCVFLLYAWWTWALAWLWFGVCLPCQWEFCASSLACLLAWEWFPSESLGMGNRCVSRKVWITPLSRSLSSPLLTFVILTCILWQKGCTDGGKQRKHRQGDDTRWE